MKIRDISTWESFYWVAKEQNFSRAAKMLRIGPSLLSKRIFKLEEDLGVRLFHRSTRKVSLTQEGQILFPKTEAFLQDAQGMEDQFEEKTELSGTIRLACITAFTHRVMAPLIAEFSKKHPQVEFDINPSDAFLDLIDEQLDLVIRVQEPKGADFVFKKLLKNNLVFCASPEYLKSFKKEIRKPEDLLSHKILMLKVYEDCKIAKSDLKLGDLSKAQKIHSESGLLLTELATCGLGIAVRSLWDVQSLIKLGKLVQV